MTTLFNTVKYFSHPFRLPKRCQKMSSNSAIERTVRFLDGSLVTYTVPDSSPHSLIRQICSHHPEPIHPLQVVLSGVGNNNNTLALLMPHKRVVLSEFRHILSIPDILTLDLNKFDKVKMCNPSLLRHILDTTPVDKIPLALFQNPHPIVVEWLHSSGHIDRLNAVEGPISAIENKRDREVFSTILLNQELVDLLLYRWANEDVFIREIPHAHPRVLDALFKRYKNTMAERPDMVQQRTIGLLVRQILSNVHITEEMLATIVPTMTNVWIYEELRHLTKIWGVDRECSECAWRVLYEKWQSGPFCTDSEQNNVIKWTNQLMHLKQYDTVIGNPELSQDDRDWAFLYFATNVCDSDEVAEWLLSEGNEEIRAWLTSKYRLTQNTHPKIVEWSLSNAGRWKNLEFAQYNTHPLAVAKTVEWWLDPSEKTILPFAHNLEALWEILAALHDPHTTSGVREVRVTDFVAALQFSDAEIVFDL